MIGWLNGTLLHAEGSVGVLNVNGVGYELRAPEGVLAAWLAAEEAVEVHVHTAVREDALELFGFATRADRDVFRTLLSVSGVGPRLALACLQTLPAARLAAAVESEDVATLSQVPGVGKKTAQRMAIDLKGRLHVSGGLPVMGKPLVAASTADPLALALDRLGYKRGEVATAIEALKADGLGPDQPVQSRLKAALRLLYAR